MTRTWTDIRKQQSLEVEEAGKHWVAAELARLPLAELRRARSLTQQRMSELLDMDQGAISKLEHRTDMYLSTLRSYVEALGGQLRLTAVFPNSEVPLDRVEDIGSEALESRLRI